MIRALTTEEADELLSLMGGTPSPYGGLSLLDFVPALTEKFEAPHHLARLLDRVQCALTEPLRIVCSTPPRHGKTESLLHLVPWLLLQDPSTQISYISYSQRFAEKKSRKARELAIRAGVPIASDSRARADWRTGVGDGGLWATSIGGSVTGEGFHCMLVDDPVKDRATAESAIAREHQYEWFTDTAFTRLEPNGSCIVNMARWHEDDLAGRLIKDGWEHINLQALSDDGAALWPERWGAEQLQELRHTMGEYGWASLYQGEPRPRGGSVFRDVEYYDTLPNTYRVGIGIDLAYTSKTHADWSVAISVAESEGKYYVLDVRREQTTPPQFAAHLRSLNASHPGAQMLWYTSTTERGLADLLREQSGFPIRGELAKADKFVRAQPVAAAWNARKVLVPRRAPWLSTFVNEVCSFTGTGDRHDDQVDALAAAFDVLAHQPASLSDFTAFRKIAPRTRF